MPIPWLESYHANFVTTRTPVWKGQDLTATVVTGAAGFIGNMLAQDLAREDRSLCLIDDFSSGKNLSVDNRLQVNYCDIRKASDLDQVLPDEIDVVYHCAAQSSGEISFDDPWDDLTRHVHATFYLLAAAKQRSAERFVYTSSMAVYGEPLKLPIKETSPTNPKSFYGAGKLAAESYVRLFQSLGLPTVIVRPFSVYGASQDLGNLRQGMVSIFMSQLLRSGRISVKGSLERFRDFIHIDDAVAGLRLLGEEATADGQTVNLCTATRTSVRDVLDTIITAADTSWDEVEISSPTPGDQLGITGSNELLTELTGWKPRWTVSAGIPDMWSKISSTSPNGPGPL